MNPEATTTTEAPATAAPEAGLAPEVSLAKIPAKRFRRPFNAVRPSPDQMRRQGRVSQVAWSALGGRDAVMAFLNTHDDALGGRPLDLALASDDGLLAVERALAERKAA